MRKAPVIKIIKELFYETYHRAIILMPFLISFPFHVKYSDYLFDCFSRSSLSKLTTLICFIVLYGKLFRKSIYSKNYFVLSN